MLDKKGRILQTSGGKKIIKQENFLLYEMTILHHQIITLKFWVYLIYLKQVVVSLSLIFCFLILSICWLVMAWNIVSCDASLYASVASFRKICCSIGCWGASACVFTQPQDPAGSTLGTWQIKKNFVGPEMIIIFKDSVLLSC